MAKLHTTGTYEGFQVPLLKLSKGRGVLLEAGNISSLLLCMSWKTNKNWGTCGRNPEHYGTSILDCLKNARVRVWLLISYELHVFLTKRTPCVYSTPRGLKPFRVGVTVSLYRLLYRQFANLLCKGSLVLDLCRRVWRRSFQSSSSY